MYGTLVGDGGYQEGVLVDQTYEEELHGPFTEKALEAEKEIIRRQREAKKKQV